MSSLKPLPKWFTLYFVTIPLRQWLLNLTAIVSQLCSLTSGVLKTLQWSVQWSLSTVHCPVVPCMQEAKMELRGFNFHPRNRAEKNYGRFWQQKQLVLKIVLKFVLKSAQQCNELEKFRLDTNHLHYGQAQPEIWACLTPKQTDT